MGASVSATAATHAYRTMSRHRKVAESLRLF